MPLYEYKCHSCGENFEVMQKFSDDPLTVHEACGGPVERLLSPPALQFKGSGWYVTDYAGKNGNSRSSKDAAKDSPKSAESPSKSESKTETKSSAGSTSDKKG